MTKKELIEQATGKKSLCDTCLYAYNCTASDKGISNDVAFTRVCHNYAPTAIEVGEVSAEEALSVLTEWVKRDQELLEKNLMDTTENIAIYKTCIKALEDARQTGKWIDLHFPSEYYAPEYQCSLCGGKNHWSNYCPKCGARMSDEKEESK